MSLGLDDVEKEMALGPTLKGRASFVCTISGEITFGMSWFISNVICHCTSISIKVAR